MGRIGKRKTEDAPTQRQLGHTKEQGPGSDASSEAKTNRLLAILGEQQRQVGGNHRAVTISSAYSLLTGTCALSLTQSYRLAHILVLTRVRAAGSLSSLGFFPPSIGRLPRPWWPSVLSPFCSTTSHHHSISCHDELLGVWLSLISPSFSASRKLLGRAVTAAHQSTSTPAPWTPFSFLVGVFQQLLLGQGQQLLALLTRSTRCSRAPAAPSAAADAADTADTAATNSNNTALARPNAERVTSLRLTTCLFTCTPLYRVRTPLLISLFFCSCPFILFPLPSAYWTSRACLPTASRFSCHILSTNLFSPSFLVSSESLMKKLVDCHRAYLGPIYYFCAVPPSRLPTIFTVTFLPASSAPAHFDISAVWPAPSDPLTLLSSTSLPRSVQLIKQPPNTSRSFSELCLNLWQRGKQLIVFYYTLSPLSNSFDLPSASYTSSPSGSVWTVDNTIGLPDLQQTFDFSPCFSLHLLPKINT